MSVIRACNQNVAENTNAAAYWTISTIRRSFHGSRCHTATPRAPSAFLADLDIIGALFRKAQERMVALQSVGMVIAPPGTTGLTCHERRLLRASIAAQAADEVLVDNYLCKLASHPKARPLLAHAVMTLVTSLATSGHWLPTSTLPAPALRVARLHGADLQAINIAWADSAGETHVFC